MGLWDGNFSLTVKAVKNVTHGKYSLDKNSENQLIFVLS